MLGIRSYIAIIVVQHSTDYYSVYSKWRVVAQCSYIGGNVHIKIKRSPLSVCALIAKVYIPMNVAGTLQTPTA